MDRRNANEVPIRNLGTSPALSSEPPPGWVGSPRLYSEAQAAALAWADAEGWDRESLVEIPVQWGEQDTFRHVNNVIYLRWFETGRISFISSLARSAAAREGRSHEEADVKAAHMIQGKDVGIILGTLSARYRRPVTFPDTVLIAHRVKAESLSRRGFDLEGACYSYSQRTVVTTSVAGSRWYDYDNLKATECNDTMMEILKHKTGKTCSSSKL